MLGHLIAPALFILLGLSVSPVLAQSPLAVIGGESAPAGQEIGRLGPMLVTDQHVLVFDRADQRLRVYSRDGKPVQVVGRPGAGPGEYRAIYSMARDSSGHLFLLDAANGRITTYVEGDTLRMTGTRAIEISGYGLCSAADKLFVSSFQQNGLVHQFAMGATDARIAASFGEPRIQGPLGLNPMIQERMGNNPIACVPDEPVIMLASRDLGIVEIIRTDAQDQHAVELPGFERMMIESGDGSLTFGVPESGHYDMLVDIQPAAGGAVAIVHRVKGTKDNSVEYRRYFIALTGAVRLLGRSAWQQVGAGRGLTYCAAENPFPEVAIFRGTSCP